VHHALEIRRMTGQTALPIGHESGVGDARRAAVRLAERAGLPAARAAAVALLATELATNLARHARDGELLMQALASPVGPAVELLSVDRGPGMADVERCLVDGFSTGGTAGSGLGAVRRIADDFDIYSRPGWGTLVFARVHGRPAAAERFDWGCISLPAARETVCGDGWALRQLDHELMLMVADGLGHGPLAAEAAEEACRLFAEEPPSEPTAFLERAHRSLGATRGAAIGVVHGSASDLQLTFAGVGNVAGAVVEPAGQRSFAAHNGTVGAHLPRLRAFEYPWPDRSLLVLHSDGLRARWDLRDYPGLHARHPALVAAALYRDYRRPNDDVTVLVARAAAA
jgi:anti-sigma regulatory factor (Ser/Thr protein kinase)